MRGGEEIGDGPIARSFAVGAWVRVVDGFVGHFLVMVVLDLGLKMEE